MIKIFFLSIFFIFIIQAKADDKKKIILNFEKINNLSFDFEQNINGKIEKGNCIIEYPKKIFCKYYSKNNKILVSNGKSIVIKTNIGSYYRYNINRTPLDLILDKKFIINEIRKMEQIIKKNGLIIYKIYSNNQKIDIFFDENNFYLKGWKTIDVYQNTSITYIHNTLINQRIEQKKFILPRMD
jgi:outer membrane lipoprotein-sorting protein